MKAQKTERGFIRVWHPAYANGDDYTLIQESSVIGEYDDAAQNPGSSALHISNTHHLYREEVREMIERMQYWLDNKRLKID